MDYSPTKSDAPENVSSTLGGIVHLSDLMAAAVAEVEGAWSDFVHGQSPETPGGRGEAMPMPRNRIEGTRDSLQSSIGRLRVLSNTIRELT